MSIRVMTQVWDCGHYEGGSLLVLLAMADWAHDDGTHVFPTVDKLAEKARLTPRAVQQNLKKLREDGIIVLVAEASGKRGHAREWRVDLERLKNLHPSTVADGAEHTESRGEELAVVKDSVGAADCTPAPGESDGCKNFAPQDEVGARNSFTPEAGSTDGCSGLQGTGESADVTGANGSKSPKPPYIDNRHLQPLSEPLSHPPSAGAREADPVAEQKAPELPTFLRRFPEEFNGFIAAYPKTGEGLGETFEAWKATKKHRPTLDLLLRFVGYYVVNLANENRIRPPNNQRQPCHASRWLREHRWECYETPVVEAKAEITAEERMLGRRRAWGGHPAVEILCAKVGEGIFDTWYAVCRLTFVDGIPKIIAPSRLVRDELVTKHWHHLEEVFKGDVIVELSDDGELVAA